MALRELTVKYYDEEKKDYFKALYCGATKSGKTYLAGTYPNPFFIDTDGGGRTLKGTHIPFLSYSIAGLREGDAKNRPQPYEEIRFVLQKMIQNKGRIWINKETGSLHFDSEKEGYEAYDVKTLVFDSLTMLADLLLYEAGFDNRIGETKSQEGKKDLSVDNAQRAEYGVLRKRLVEIFDYTKDLRMNIVATAFVDGGQDEKGEWRVSKNPAVQGSFRSICGHYFDLVALLEEDQVSPGKYYLYSQTHKFGVGTRDKLPAKIENPSYQKIVEEMKKMEVKK